MWEIIGVEFSKLIIYIVVGILIRFFCVIWIRDDKDWKIVNDLLYLRVYYFILIYFFDFVI